MTSIRQLSWIYEFDWGGNLKEIHSSLTRLRISRIRQFQSVILLSPLVGFSGLIVSLQWLLDLLPESQNVFEVLDAGWIIANFAFGVLFVPVGWGIARVLAKQNRHRGWWRRMLDDIGGKSIKRSELELRRWEHLGLSRPDGSLAKP